MAATLREFSAWSTTLRGGLAHTMFVIHSEAASFQALNYMDSVLNVSLSIMFVVAALAYRWLAL
jgi:hypothetical protein